MPDNHTWSIQSSHHTSGGTVTYLRCACGQFLVRCAGSAAPPTTEIEIAPAQRCPTSAAG